MARTLLVVALAIGARAQNSGTSSADLCYGTCSTDGAGVKTCSFAAKINPYASYMGYWQFTECGDTVQPVLAIEQNVEYTFDQSDETNWYHPLGYAYFADGAHKGVDELEPAISQSGSSCVDTNTCQAPMYYKDGAYAGGTYDGGSTAGDDNFGLDDYEPEFFFSKEDWLGTTYSVKLTITDTTYTGDIFYFCHIHNDMSGRMKVVNSDGDMVNPDMDSPDLGYEYVIPSAFDAMCGTYDTSDYQSGTGMCDDTFVCESTSSSLASFGSCLQAMDCHMQYNMKSYIHTDNPVVTFIHQMIPHHQNAVNMAKLLMTQYALDADDEDDAGMIDMLWSIVNVQNYQINTMQGWLDAKGYAANALCIEEQSNGMSTCVDCSGGRRNMRKLLFGYYQCCR